MPSTLSLCWMSVNLNRVQTFIPRSQGRLWDGADHGDIGACSVSPLWVLRRWGVAVAIGKWRQGAHLRRVQLKERGLGARGQNAAVTGG